MERHGDEVDLTGDEARAGSTPHIVRWVLGISLIMAAGAMTVIWISGALDANKAAKQALTVPLEPADPAAAVDSEDDTPSPAEDVAEPLTSAEDETAQ